MQPAETFSQPAPSWLDATSAVHFLQVVHVDLPLSGKEILHPGPKPACLNERCLCAGTASLNWVKAWIQKTHAQFFFPFSLRLLWVAEMWKLNKLMEKREIIRLSQKAVLSLNILSQFQARFLHVWQHHASCILCQRQLDSQWRQPFSQCKFLIIVQCLYKYTLNKSKQLT